MKEPNKEVSAYFLAKLSEEDIKILEDMLAAHYERGFQEGYKLGKMESGQKN
ncbi:hypothetical protein [Alteribacillus iranensis]|uniref:Uncharacterized protein n=1 Tax=Alteribacillus iranensis TaxID=930128 RepID=A0A1I2D0U3_9BACI|nr:hypothetical protein [Alteribacillus iranensis]SFE74131.1 hypothetical protein SAMN05192532_103325 [Alteribacillus iranensis]